MNYLDENTNNFLEYSPIYENIPSPNYCPLPSEINIIPKEDCIIYAKNDDNNKYKEPLIIFNEKKTKDTKEIEELIGEKNLIFIEKKKKWAKALYSKIIFELSLKPKKKK
jgi:hypothetical protein